MQWLSDPLASQTFWVGVGIGSAIMFFGTLLAIPRLVARLHADYFVGPSPPARRLSRHPFWSFLGRLLRNLVGILLLAAGIAMLVLPGQGVLTILIGLAMLDFPGKRGLEKRLAKQKHVRKSLQWLRERADVEPLRFDD